MAGCLNRICMNIIKAKCIGNKNLYYLGNIAKYDSYKECMLRYDATSPLLNEEEFVFMRTWIAKKPRKTKEGATDE